MNHGGYKLPQGMPTALYPEEYLGRETGAPYRLRINGGPLWTVPELVFEKKQLIPALQQLLVCCQTLTA